MTRYLAGEGLGRRWASQWLMMAGVACLSDCLVAAPTGIRVESLDPAPNYAVTTDVSDLSQLTDGQTNRSPWSSVSGVGWQNANRLLMRLTVAGVQDSHPFSATLRLHSGTKQRSGIHVPLAADVYALERERYVHVGGANFAWDDTRPDGDRWLELPVHGASADLVLILYGRGMYVFLDEIALAQVGPGPQQTEQRRGDTLGSVEEVFRDSRKRLEARLWADYGRLNALVPLPHRSDTLVVWKQPAWAVIEPRLAALPVGNAVHDGFSMLAVVGADAMACLGLYNAGDRSRSLRLGVSDSGNLPLRLSQLVPVVTGSGKIVYDAIVPFAADASLQLGPGQFAFVWVEAPAQPQAGHRVGFLLLQENGREPVRVPVSVSWQQIRLGAPPRAVVWAYRHDVPIWRNPASAVRDLHEHGVNVTVLHPREIPMPRMTGQWDTRKATILAEAAGRIGRDELALLYLNWERERLAGEGLGFLDFQGHEPSPALSAVLQTWLSRLKSVMVSAGLRPDQWALYPVDEPDHEDMAYVLRLFRALKRAQPQVNIYVNPVPTPGSFAGTPVTDIAALAPYVDIWQPRLSLARGHGAAVYAATGRPFWIYDNPPYPAKDAEPLRHYRLLAWEAWALGATGVGFWSYSDTWQTSAWDDFDGHAADWAVVYESSSGPARSRRWLAFKQGVLDYRLFEALATENAAQPQPELRARVRALLASRLDSDTAEAFTAQLMGAARR